MKQKVDCSHTSSVSMPHRLVMTNAHGRRIFDFEVEREERNGWAWLRLTRIEDDPPLSNGTAVQRYDPTIHNEDTPYASHYMSKPWRARGRRRWLGDGVTRYCLVGAFGTPGYMQLEYIEELLA